MNAPRVWRIMVAVGLVVLVVPVIGALAAPLSGAIFTTTPDGAIVNENVHYNAKIDVYLDGGPGPNAPQTAAGLPDGQYYFQVTDPSGKVLLSQDPAICRKVQITGGVITALLSIGNTYTVGKTTVPCSIQDPPTPPYDPSAVQGVAGPSGRHDTNQDVDHGPPAIVVQLMPFYDTPNPGGVYKAWMIPVATYVANGGNPTTVPQPYKVRGVQVGYQRDPGFGPPRDQVKTDNFKVKEFFPPEITVRKFEDLNGNGVWDPGEPEIGVDKLINGGGWPYNFTEPVDGGTVTNLFYTPYTHVAGLPGAYTACEVRLPGWEQSSAILDGVRLNADQCVTVNVAGTSGEKHTIIFGNYRNATKSGVKFHDLNANGVRNAGEPVLSGWTIKLDGTDGMGNTVSKSTTTDVNGKYSFSVPPGTYKVCEVLVANWYQSFPSAGCYNVTLISGEVDDNNDFGNYQYATKSGVKFHDLNANGIKNNGEPLLWGWTITLEGKDGFGNTISKSTTTDANGKYTFSVPPGTYKVCEAQVANWYQSLPAGGLCYNITLISQQVDDDNNFGNYQYATKSGVKFHDLNGDGIKDAGEPGLANWTITLEGKDGWAMPVSKTTTTDVNGKYSFSVPPGSYTVCEVLVANWYQSVPAGGGCYNITLISQQLDDNNDFGNYQYATKSGVKFNDLNGDGVKDAGEPGLANWTITLEGKDGWAMPISKTTTTDANGEYTFSVPPGSYTVCEVQKAGWIQTIPAAGGCYNITLISQQVDDNNHFGNFKMPTVTACKLSDADGKLATIDDEAPVPNWPVYLSIDGVRQLPAQYTGSDGCFTWTDLLPGHSYDVEEDVLTGWAAVTPTTHDFGPATSGAAYSFTFVNTPNQGCTPGYWKVPQHWESWPAPWVPNNALSDMFSEVLNLPYLTYTVTFSDDSTVQMGSASQVQALNFQGGSTVQGKAEILLRAAVAAVLNADSPDVLYPLTSAQVIEKVNAALASKDPTIILNLGNLLDADNNGRGGCPLH